MTSTAGLELSQGFINYSRSCEPNPIRSALAEVILGLISATELSARRVFEQQLEALQVTEEYGIFLTELTLDGNGQLAMRQMAGVLLKQYVDAHWCIDANKFKEPEASLQTKATIRAILPHGLKESISKVRSSVAYCISSIAHWDWPDEWPELFNILTGALRGNENDPQTPFLVHGAVRVLKEFTRDITDNQIPQVAPIIFPDLYRIFVDQEGRYTVRTRSRAIEIFTTLSTMICTIGEVNKTLSKTVMEPVLPKFTEALVGGLSLPDSSHLTDTGLKTAILKALTILVKNVPKIMSPWLSQVLPPVWATLTSSADTYVREVVNAGDADDDHEEVVDSDGEVVGFENLVFAIFEFVHALVETPKFRPSVKQGLADLMYYIVLYMQITNDQCEKWTENPDQFVEDEDEDSFTYSVRISSQDLLTALCEEFEEECCVSLAQTIQRHLNESSELAASGTIVGAETSWKRREAAMLALGTAQEVIESQITSGNVEFDIKGFLENVVLVDIANPVSPFLLGRCLWIGSKFPKYLARTSALHSGDQNLSNSPMGRFVEATVRGLQSDQLAVVRIAAVRAIWGFCSHLRSTASKKSQHQDEASIERALLNPVLPATIDALLDMCSTFSKSTEILGLILENMAVVLGCDANFTASYESKVSPLAIAIFLKYSTDPVLTSLLQDIFRVIAETPKCLLPLESRLVPTLVSILDAPVSPDTNSIGSSSAAESNNESFNMKSGVTLGLQAVALDVLQTLVRASIATPPGDATPHQSTSNQKQPLQDCLSDLVINRAFPAAVRSTLNTDDNAVMQSGGECLRAYVSVAPNQVSAFMDADGKTGLWYMVQVAAQLLNPTGSEFTATFVGRLVTTLIQKTGDRLGSDLDALLKAVLSKLQGSETLSVIQSLLMVYAQLVHTQLEAVLSFLCSVPGPTGETALDFVLTQWVSRQHLFYGAYETKVSIVALAKLLQHGVNNNDTRLQNIVVNGDLIMTAASNTARTRSQKRTNPDQWTRIPVLVKIFKLLVQELTTNMDAALDFNSADEDSEEETTEDPNGLDGLTSNNANKGVDLSDLLDAATAAKNGTGLGFFDDEGLDEEEDPDALADPLYNMNICRYLTEFVSEFARQPFFAGHFNTHLNQSEKTTLATIGVL